MSARILVVDDLAPNRKLLEVKLAADYYDVVSVSDGPTAIEAAREGGIDLVLLDAMMPGMDGFETCRQLKADSRTWQIPIIMVTALEEKEDRVRGLEAGADDFITKPIDDFNLTARVRSLLRLKMVTDQLLSHTGHDAERSRPLIDRIDRRAGRILVVEDDEFTAQRIDATLSPQHSVLLESRPKKAIELARAGVDVVIVSLESQNFDGLRICANLRFGMATKDIPLLAIGDPSNEAQLVRAFDMGINDTLMRPLEVQELRARVNTQLRRKFYADSLRENFNENLDMVVTDPLTGLGNRRHFDRSMRPLLDDMEERGMALSLLVCDIDHFKRVNDILGHDMGDTILKEVAARLASNLRAVDVVARYGGEEFMIAMPDTTEADALVAAERLRKAVGRTPIAYGGQALSVTTSVGVAEVKPGEKLRDVFRRADDALYKAKHAGRNRVMKAA